MCLSISLTQSYREVKYKPLSLLKTIKWNWWGVRGEEVFNFLLYISELMFYSSKSCPTPCDPMDCSLPGSSVHGILQGRILEWVTMPSSRGSSQPRVRTESPTLQVDSLPSEPQRKPKNATVGNLTLPQRIFPTQGLNRGLPTLQVDSLAPELPEKPYFKIKHTLIYFPLTLDLTVILLYLSRYEKNTAT